MCARSAVCNNVFSLRTRFGCAQVEAEPPEDPPFKSLTTFSDDATVDAPDINRANDGVRSRLGQLALVAENVVLI